MTNVGPFVEGSFKVGDVTMAPTLTDNVLSYQFSEGTKSPQSITFKTKIIESKLYNQNEQIVNNKAVLNLSEQEQINAETSVKFTPKWISKAGKASG